MAASVSGVQEPTELASELAAPKPKTLAAAWRRHGGWMSLVLLLAAGGAARWALSRRDGHLFDVDLFLHWMRKLTAHGLSGFYDAAPGCNYPPLYLLTLRGLGWLLSQMDPALSNTAWLRAWLRLPACLADGFIAVLLYMEVRRFLARRAAIAAAALYFLNPAVLYNSAYWGQVDSIHSALALAAVAALNRGRSFWAGMAIALAVLQKLQAVAFLPLLLLDVYRWKRWGGLARCGAGAVAAAALVLGPFTWAGVLPAALERGYVRVIGQYDKLTYNAFNLWQLTGIPEAPDDAVPAVFVRTIAGDGVSVPDDAHWLLRLTWRRLGMLLFCLATACVLALYSRRHSPSARSLAAGLLGLAFFLFLTEMHERYAFPVLALLPIWAVGGAWRERSYVLLSAAMLLNLTVAQPVAEIGGELSAVHLLIFGLFLAALFMPAAAAASRRVAKQIGDSPWRVYPGAPLNAKGPCHAEDGGDKPRRSLDSADRFARDLPAPPRSALVTWFRWATVAFLLAFAVIAGVIAYRYKHIAPPRADNVLYLSDLTPVQRTQGYGRLAQDRSVEGNVIQLGNRYYLRGLGTHAPASVVYALPEGYRSFCATVGVNRRFDGTVRVEVFLDGNRVFSSGPLTAADPPVEIRVGIEGAGRLKLAALSLHDKKGDHVDWALARLEK